MQSFRTEDAAQTLQVMQSGAGITHMAATAKNYFLQLLPSL